MTMRIGIKEMPADLEELLKGFLQSEDNRYV